jgi:hypothetical protein
MPHRHSNFLVLICRNIKYIHLCNYLKKSGSEIAKNNSAGRETENSANFVKKIYYPGFEATSLPPHKNRIVAT